VGEKIQNFQLMRQSFQGKILMDESLSEHTSFHIGGPADYYVYPKDLEDLREIVNFCKREGVPRFIIGNGTNLLVSDEGFRGIVIDLSRTFTHIRCKGETVTAGTGIPLRHLLKYNTERGLSGMESLVGIPGQVGGAICLNAGAWGGEMKDCLDSVTFLDKYGTVETKYKAELEFGYRISKLPDEAVLIEAQFRLSEGNPKEMEAIQMAHVKNRREKQPLSLPSAGSIFKRPEKDYAGRLIEEAGCKGLRIGDAMVSKKHANFIVNCRLASAQDVLRLIDEVKNRVYQRFEVILATEIHFLGFEK
jgi:UDP-N-acetylmuramate dehydrogenase